MEQTETSRAAMRHDSVLAVRQSQGCWWLPAHMQMAQQQCTVSASTARLCCTHWFSSLSSLPKSCFPKPACVIITRCPELIMKRPVGCCLQRGRAASQHTPSSNSASVGPADDGLWCRARRSPQLPESMEVRYTTKELQ